MKKKASHKRTLKSAGWCGISASLIATILFGAAINSAPWFSWENNALSDLGVHFPSAPYFNAGLIILGIMSFVIGRGIWLYIEKNRIGLLGLTWLFGGTSMLIGLAVFPIDVGYIHYVIAASFFVLVPASMAAIGISEIQNKKNKGFISLLLSILSGVVWILPWPGSGIAIPEIASSSCIIIFGFLYGITILKETTNF